LIQPASGEMQHAVAGHVYGAVLGDSMRTVVVDGSPPLGTEPDVQYPATCDRLAPGEILVVLSEGVQRSLTHDRQRDFWNLIRDHRGSSADDLLGKVEGLLGDAPDRQGGEDQTVLILKRESH
jgi:serine phosphatase RsbU (regulator of sigma subunit)